MGTISETVETRTLVVTALRLPGERTLRWIALGAIVALAAVLRFANLGALGDANHYYTAAVKAMLQSWHNFYFVAAEPGGSVSVDKPPVGLWLQAISAYFLGVNGLGVLLPQILAGILSVVVVYHLVRRTFGTAAGLLAALALAITPIVVATDRNNTIDSTLILTLLLAAWAFIKATESRQLRYLLLGAALVGIGFNIKMLEAYLPLPAFYALYFLGSRERLLPKVGKLALATLVLAVVSLAWAVSVDLTPANQRPYVGSSGNNSELELIVGYNGMERLLGMGGRGGLLSSLLNNTRGQGQFPNRGFQPPQGFRAPQGGNGLFGGGTPGFGGGFFNTGTPGALRLFVAPLSKETSWLLPFGLLTGLVLALRTRLRWPLEAKHTSLVLWGGWLLIGSVFFSVAGFFHEYYLSLLAPPVAALFGIGVAELWSLRERHPWLAIGLLLVAGAATLWLQFTTASAVIGLILWLPFMFGLFLIGATFLITTANSRVKSAAVAGFACIIAALLITPGIWSVLTNVHASTNQSLPAAYSPGASFGPAGRGGAGTSLTGLQVDQGLLSFLDANTQGEKYLMAVPSSMQGSDYVIATGRPVLYLGGFDGQDRVETAESLSQMVQNGELRYIYWNSRGGRFGGPGGGNQSDIASWLANSCKIVTGYDTQAESAGAPGGTITGATTTIGSFGRGFGGGNLLSLYDCGG